MDVISLPFRATRALDRLIGQSDRAAPTVARRLRPLVAWDVKFRVG